MALNLSMQRLVTSSQAIKGAYKIWTNTKSVKENLELVDISYNQLEEVDISSIPHKIKTLHLYCNKIEIFPDVHEFKNLVELSLSYNKMTSLEVQCLPQQIEIIKINGNLLNSIPNLKRFTQLKIFEARTNNIKDVWGLPENIAKLDLSENPVTHLALDCFPNEKVYELLKNTLTESDLMKFEEPPKSTFLKGYLPVMSYYVDLRAIKKKLNQLFTKHHNIKVQSLYEDEDWHKVIVNVKKEHGEKIRTLLRQKFFSPYVHVVEQPNSPKLTSGRIASGSQLEIQNKNPALTTGTIAAKIIDKQDNVYILTCGHLFNSNSFSSGEGIAEAIYAYTDTKIRLDLGTKYTGLFGPVLLQDDTANEPDVDEIWVDIALVQITNTDIINELDDIILENENCQLFLYDKNCDIEMKNQSVQKFGATTGKTTGRLLKTNFMFYYPPTGEVKKGSNTILIKADAGVFLKDGDSGSLLTSTLRATTNPPNHTPENHALGATTNPPNHTPENHALGICVAQHNDFVHCDKGVESTIDAGIVVKLHMNLQALQEKFPHLEDLRVCCSKEVLYQCSGPKSQ